MSCINRRPVPYLNSRMKFVSALSILSLLSIVGAKDAEPSGEVVVLNKENYEGFLADNKVTLIEYFAPCKLAWRLRWYLILSDYRVWALSTSRARVPKGRFYFSR